MRLFAVLLGVFLLQPQVAGAACELARVNELPVVINGLRAEAHLTINGTEVPFIIDSGAFYSMMSPATASQLQLPLEPPPPGFQLRGLGGTITWHIVTVKEVRMGSTALHNVQFIVGSAGPALLGQNFLHVEDVEYDFANGALRLWRPRDCRKALLAHWVKDNQPYSMMNIGRSSAGNPYTVGKAYVNGSSISVTFDTGASTSVLSLRAAARAGVKPDSPGVTQSRPVRGIGSQSIETWIAPFASFKIGDEEIRNTHLRIGDIDVGTDMLIGADFFLSHRIYVANSQRRLYFTYNGGPVFNLTTQPGDTTAADATEPAKDDTGTAGPVDAAGYARRAAIHLVRRDFARAIADLNRAIEKDPHEVQYFRDRARAYMENGQLQLAQADLDRVLTLKSGDVQALLQRAGLHLAARQIPAGLTDLGAASGHMAREDDAHLLLGQLYAQAAQYTSALAHYDLWLAFHDEHPLKPEGLQLRCRARALAGTELDKALSDCNRALSLVKHKNAEFMLETRGLVRLRSGDIDKALADYDEALALKPDDPKALYGRGLARLRKGHTAEGRADLAAARALQADVAEGFAEIGLKP